MSMHDQIPEAALHWYESGRGVALATVVETWGSAPRQVGAQLVVADDESFDGSVSGGCVEGAVVAEALDAIKDGKCRLLEYGVSDQDAFASGLACGGTIKVLVEPIGIGDGPMLDQLRALVAARSDRAPSVWCVNLESWERIVSTDISPGLGERALSRLCSDKSGLEGEWFIGVHNPPLRLIIVGAAHIAQVLAPMSRMAGHDPFLVDPRSAFSTPERFPGIEISQEWPDATVAELKPDARTAVVTLSHDPKIDDPAIQSTLLSEAYYIGCLGSKKTHASRVSRLITAGFDQDQIARIKGPVGLDIGAKTPPEIAVSILAEMTQELRKGSKR